MNKEFRSCFLSRLAGKESPLNRRIIVVSLLAVLLVSLPQLSRAGAGKNPGSKNDNSAALIMQQRVTGTITDASTGEPLVGVNIVVEGTTTGTMTDINGKFTIEAPSRNSVLSISYIGYVSLKVNVEGRAIIDVSMESDLRALEEVVVTGYGTVRKSDLTGSVSSIKTEQILQLPTQRVD